VFGSASVPLSAVGARLAINADVHRLERVAGVLLAVIAAALLINKLV
jgi:uncharacterized membrane protein YfcA